MSSSVAVQDSITKDAPPAITIDPNVPRSNPFILPNKPARPSHLIELSAVDLSLSSYGLASQWMAKELMEEAPGKYGLFRDFEFCKFKHAVDFFNDVVRIVKSENHHPVMIVNFRKVSIRTYTHCGVRIESGSAGETRTADQGVSDYDIRLAVLLEELWQSYVTQGFHGVATKA